MCRAFPFQKIVLTVAAVVAASWGVPGKAATYSGTLPTGYSDSIFQIGSDTTRLSIDVNALGTRDASICSTCNSTYTDNYTVNFYDSTGQILKSYNEVNYLYYNMYTSSHGIGAGPVSVGAPTGAATMEIVSQLTIAGLLGTDGLPLGLGNLSIVSDGSLMAATPIPSSVTLMASMLGLVGVFAWYRRKKGSAALTGPALAGA